MKRHNLKVAIVAAGLNHQTLAARVNIILPTKQRVEEHTITQFVTCRKDPTLEQVMALAEVLGKNPRNLFSSHPKGQP